MNSTELKKKIEEITVPILERFAAFLVDIVIRFESGKKMIVVFVDTEQGVTINECAEMSRAIGGAFDETDVIQGAYCLEVSSPGLDKPLKLLRQYVKNIGREFTVKFKKESEYRQCAGVIARVEGENITIQPEKGEPYVLLFSEIIEAKEVLPW